MFFNFFSHKWLSYFLLLFYFAKAISNNDSDDNEVFVQPTTKRFVIMTRHGETQWSKDKIFCGWYDSPLTEYGRTESKDCAKYLIDGGFQFEKAYTSLLSRASESLDIILANIGQKNIPVTSSWKLNERHYGNLTGFKKEEIKDETMLEIWRRSYNVPPPAINSENSFYNEIQNNESLKKLIIADGMEFPKTETLETTKDRVAPYWDEVIKPEIQNENRVLIVAHGTVLRALIMHIEDLTEEEIGRVEVPTAIPFIYTFNSDMTLSIKRKYLADDELVKKKMEENKKIKKCPDCK